MEGVVGCATIQGAQGSVGRRVGPLAACGALLRSARRSQVTLAKAWNKLALLKSSEGRDQLCSWGDPGGSRPG